MKVAALSIVSVSVLMAASPAILASGRSLSTLNDSIQARAGETYDTLASVNGEIRVASGVTVDEAKSVNGQIVLDENVKIGTVSTVNGSLHVGEGTAIAHDASTVNGSLKLKPHSRVGGDASTVSGNVDVDSADVAGWVITVNGDVDLVQGAHVHGGIHVKAPNDLKSKAGDKPVKVNICATCMVDGELRFDRPVILHVEPGAKIGKVTGDSVTRR